MTREVTFAVTPFPLPIPHDLSSAEPWHAQSEVPNLDSLLYPQV